MQLTPGWPAGGALVRAGAYPIDNPGFDPWVAAGIAPVMKDLDTADFDDTSRSGDGGRPFLQLAVGTPKAGTCWTELTATALKSSGGQGGSFDVRVVRPGPRMSAYHLTFMCIYSRTIVPQCAWSGPGADGHHPLFGTMRIGVPVFQTFTEPEMAAFVEHLFKAMTRV